MMPAWCWSSRLRAWQPIRAMIGRSIPLKSITLRLNAAEQQRRKPPPPEQHRVRHPAQPENPPPHLKRLPRTDVVSPGIVIHRSFISTIRKEFMARQSGTYALINTSEGAIVCRLFEKDAPKTVANFVDLAEGKRDWTHPSTGKKSKDRLYDGTIFHRVIPSFMIQGGDPMGSGMGGPGYKFEDETKGSATALISRESWRWPTLVRIQTVPNSLSRSRPPNGSQGSTLSLVKWWKATMSSRRSREVPRGGQDRPKKDVVLQSVTIERV